MRLYIEAVTLIFYLATFVACDVSVKKYIYIQIYIPKSAIYKKSNLIWWCAIFVIFDMSSDGATIRRTVASNV